MAGLILGGAVVGFSTPSAGQGARASPANVKCTCRYRGNNVKLGETVCIQTPRGFRLARCEMTLNNTSWKFLGGSCPLATARSGRSTRS